MRLFVTLFAAMAILLSASHAAPASAHDGDLVHAVSHAFDHEHGSSDDSSGSEQYEGHHHCPSAAASDQAFAVASDSFASSRFFPLNMSRLVPTMRAPPLTPPKA